jgi:hypothetical protein
MAIIATPTRTPSQKRLPVILFIAALVLIAAAGIVVWQVVERREGDAARVVEPAADAPAAVSRPSARVADDRLTVYIVASEEGKAQFERGLAKANANRAAMMEPEITAQVIVVASPAEEEWLVSWANAMRESLGRPVRLVDLRPARGSGSAADTFPTETGFTP